MPVVMREVTVAANTRDPNLLNGSTYEISRGNVYLSMGVSAAATGVLITIYSGTDLVLEESPAIVLTRFPIIPDEMYFNDVAALADRLIIAANNTTGAGIVVRPLVQLTYL